MTQWQPPSREWYSIEKRLAPWQSFLATLLTLPEVCVDIKGGRYQLRVITFGNITTGCVRLKLESCGPGDLTITLETNNEKYKGRIFSINCLHGLYYEVEQDTNPEDNSSNALLFLEFHNKTQIDHNRNQGVRQVVHYLATMIPEQTIFSAKKENILVELQPFDKYKLNTPIEYWQIKNYNGSLFRADKVCVVMAFDHPSKRIRPEEEETQMQQEDTVFQDLPDLTTIPDLSDLVDYFKNATTPTATCSSSSVIIPTTAITTTTTTATAAITPAATVVVSVAAAPSAPCAAAIASINSAATTTNTATAAVVFTSLSSTITTAFLAAASSITPPSTMATTMATAPSATTTVTTTTAAIAVTTTTQAAIAATATTTQAAIAATTTTGTQPAIATTTTQAAIAATTTTGTQAAIAATPTTTTTSGGRIINSPMVPRSNTASKLPIPKKNAEKPNAIIETSKTVQKTKEAASISPRDSVVLTTNVLPSVIIAEKIPSLNASPEVTTSSPPLSVTTTGTAAAAAVIPPKPRNLNQKHAEQNRRQPKHRPVKMPVPQLGPVKPVFIRHALPERLSCPHCSIGTQRQAKLSLFFPAGIEIQPTTPPPPPLPQPTLPIVVITTPSEEKEHVSLNQKKKKSNTLPELVVDETEEEEEKEEEKKDEEEKEENTKEAERRPIVETQKNTKSKYNTKRKQKQVSSTYEKQRAEIITNKNAKKQKVSANTVKKITAPKRAKIQQPPPSSLQHKTADNNNDDDTTTDSEEEVQMISKKAKTKNTLPTPLQESEDEEEEEEEQDEAEQQEEEELQEEEEDAQTQIKKILEMTMEDQKKADSKNETKTFELEGACHKQGFKCDKKNKRGELVSFLGYFCFGVKANQVNPREKQAHVKKYGPWRGVQRPTAAEIEQGFIGEERANELADRPGTAILNITKDPTSIVANARLDMMYLHVMFSTGEREMRPLKALREANRSKQLAFDACVVKLLAWDNYGKQQSDAYERKKAERKKASSTTTDTPISSAKTEKMKEDIRKMKDSMLNRTANKVKRMMHWYSECLSKADGYGFTDDHKGLELTDYLWFDNTSSPPRPTCFGSFNPRIQSLSSLPPSPPEQQAQPSPQQQPSSPAEQSAFAIRLKHRKAVAEENYAAEYKQEKQQQKKRKENQHAAFIDKDTGRPKLGGKKLLNVPQKCPARHLKNLEKPKRGRPKKSATMTSTTIITQKKRKHAAVNEDDPVPAVVVQRTHISKRPEKEIPDESEEEDEEEQEEQTDDGWSSSSEDEPAQTQTTAIQEEQQQEEEEDGDRTQGDEEESEEERIIRKTW